MIWEEKIKENIIFGNVRFKMLDNDMSRLVHAKCELIDLVNFEKFIDTEEDRIPIILGTQFGLYPRVEEIKELFNGEKEIAILCKSLLSGHVAGLKIFKVEKGEHNFSNKNEYQFFTN